METLTARFNLNRGLRWLFLGEGNQNMQEMEKAESPGFCAHCARPIYVGDEITVVMDGELPAVAYHWLCWQNRNDWE